MSRKTLCVYLCALITIISTVEATAAIVTTTMAADVQARVKNKNSSSSSTFLTDSVTTTESHQNSFATASNAYVFTLGTGLLTSNTLLTVEKTSDQFQDKLQQASSELVFDFSVDSDTLFSIGGTWGFENITTDVADTLSFQLTGASGLIASDSTSVNTGISGDSFSESGILSAGEYQLSFQGQLNEQHELQNLSRGGWAVNNFQLSAVTAVPEPSSLAFLGLISVVVVGRRRRRRRKLRL